MRWVRLVFIWVLSIVMVLSFVACGDSTKYDTSEPEISDISEDTESSDVVQGGVASSDSDSSESGVVSSDESLDMDYIRNSDDEGARIQYAQYIMEELNDEAYSVEESVIQGVKLDTSEEKADNEIYIPIKDADRFKIEAKGEDENLIDWGHYSEIVYVGELESINQYIENSETEDDEGIESGDAFYAYGWLYDIIELDQYGYEVLVGGDVTSQDGVEVFAKIKGTDHYIGYEKPVGDVTLYRSTQEDYGNSLQYWDSLVEEVAEIKQDILDANTDLLEPYKIEKTEGFVNESDHKYAVADIDLSRDEDSKLEVTMVLGQPGTKGEDGIWCVETWSTNYDETHYDFKSYPINEGWSTDSATWYKMLQDKADEDDRFKGVMTDPYLVAQLFVSNAILNNDTNVDYTISMVDAVG